MIDQARLQAADDVLREAEDKAQRAVADAEHQAERLASETRERCEQELQSARMAAEQLLAAMRAEAAEEVRALRAEAEDELRSYMWSVATVRSTASSKQRGASAAAPPATIRTAESAALRSPAEAKS